MVSEVFVDTGAHYAMLNANDQLHAETKKSIAAAESEQSRFVTTDYVLDETISLLVARGLKHVVEPWLDKLFTEDLYLVIWMDRGRFDEVRRFFGKHSDKAWSFTDCFSFVVMLERRISKALAGDRHFRQAGFQPLLLDALTP